MTAVRRVLLGLIVANLVAFCWWRGYLDDFTNSAREPDRVSRQVGDQRLQVVPLSRLQPSPDAAPDAAAGIAPTPPAAAPTGPATTSFPVR